MYRKYLQKLNVNLIIGFNIMGLWGSISSACSSIGNAISSTFSSFSSTCSSVINSVAAHAPAISGALKALSIVIPHPYLKMAVPIIDAALVVIGLLATDETTEEIGERALYAQEANINASDFTNFDDYIQEIRNFDLDPDNPKDFNFGEKIAAGVAVMAWGMEEKFGEHSSDLLSLIIDDAPNLNKGEGFFTEQRVEAILKSIDNVSDVVDYFKGKLNPDTKEQVEAKLVDIEETLNPDISIKDIYDKLDKQIKS